MKVADSFDPSQDDYVPVDLPWAVEKLRELRNLPKLSVWKLMSTGGLYIVCAVLYWCGGLDRSWVIGLGLLGLFFIILEFHRFVMTRMELSDEILKGLLQELNRQQAAKLNAAPPRADGPAGESIP